VEEIKTTRKTIPLRNVRIDHRSQGSERGRRRNGKSAKTERNRHWAQIRRGRIGASQLPLRGERRLTHKKLEVKERCREKPEMTRKGLQRRRRTNDQGCISRQSGSLKTVKIREHTDAANDKTEKRHTRQMGRPPPSGGERWCNYPVPGIRLKKQTVPGKKTQGVNCF